MSPNPILRKLGFSARDRVVLIHADDVGMCQATIPAFFEMASEGSVSAGSAMVPCPWFAEAAAWWRRYPQADLGIHLTLNSEWENYRWGPVAPAPANSGLTDADGYFYRSPQCMNRPDPAAVGREMQAQVTRAEAAGVDVTHLDCHMFAMLNHGLADGYVSLGFDLRSPVFLTRQPAWVNLLSAAALDRWEEQGMPVFDHLRDMPLNQPAEAWLDAAVSIFDGLPPGLTCLLIHPAIDTPELRAICTDWRQRVADYETFRSMKLRSHLRDSGVQVIGWRPIRDSMPGRL